MPNSQLMRCACSDNHLGILMSLADLERGTKFKVLVGGLIRFIFVHCCRCA